MPNNSASMKIEEWLRDHPLINAYSVEKALGMPIGTIKKGRSIPEKYLEAIAGLLSSYGYGRDVVVIKSAEMVAVLPVTTKKAESKYYTVKEGKLYAIKEDVEEKRWDGKMGIVTRKVDNVPDGSIVICQ